MRRIALAPFLSLLLVAAPAARADAPAATGIPSGDVKSIKKDLDGLKGKVVVLNFWATWCKPCLWELPALKKLYADYSPKGVIFYSVSLDGLQFEEGESQRRLREIVAKESIPYPVVLAVGDAGALMDTFQIPGGIPFTAILDRAGKTQASYVGMLQDDQARAKLETLVKTPATR